MEEKIVILGNGFDLRHFLPTSYNHLISILSEIEKLSDNKSTITFSDLFDGVFKEKNEWFYQKINEYYQTENFIFDVESIKSIHTRLKNNSWFQYFKSVDENKIETWIDFETEISRILKVILNYFDCFNDNVFENNIIKGNFERKKLFFIDYSNTKKYFNNKLQFKILLNFNLFYHIINQRYYSVNENFILEIDDQIQYYKERDFLNVIYNSLEEFIGIFNDYIVNIINIFYSNLREEKKENFISKQEKLLFENVNQIFSFNYTPTYTKFYKTDIINVDNEFLQELELKSKKRKNFYQFLHGNAVLNWNNKPENYINDLNKMKIVLGVDDIDDSLKIHKLFQFTKYFQKLHKQTDYLFLKDFHSTNGLKSFDKYTFYFWGHSLDYSDRQYIREIFELVENSNGSKIKIFYHSISAKGDQLKNLLGIIEKEKVEKFMKFDILEFIESTSENLFKEL
ncbi:AbiH family protein [uncultured Chryseobacterium sp.]|uniref:AbiH family protein n=1 Tax=uncultured Chryseobacterium sp. TaxID=259322 RepID=UPI0025897C1A|nr:AbiH family protein [uncultured Chryseobacterium sp.]